MNIQTKGRSVKLFTGQKCNTFSSGLYTALLSSDPSAVNDASQLDIRPAVPADAARYATVAAETFFEAYVATSDPANMTAHLEREFSESKQRLELDDPAITVLAAHEPTGDWAGFATLHAGVTTSGVNAARPIEIVRFYVRGRWHGRGAARRLMEAACAFGTACGHDAIWLQVWEENARARRFYEKCGLRAVGTRPFLFGDVWEDDIVYAKSLEPSAAE